MCFKLSFISKEHADYGINLVSNCFSDTLSLNDTYAAPTNMTKGEDEYSYCTANVTSCRVTIFELYDATGDVLNVFDDLCNETDIVSESRNAR